MNLFSILFGSVAVFIIALGTSGMPLRKTLGRYQFIIVIGWVVCAFISLLTPFDLAGWVAKPLYAIAAYVSYVNWQLSKKKSP